MICAKFFDDCKRQECGICQNKIFWGLNASFFWWECATTLNFQVLKSEHFVRKSSCLVSAYIYKLNQFYLFILRAFSTHEEEIEKDTQKLIKRVNLPARVSNRSFIFPSSIDPKVSSYRFDSIWKFYLANIDHLRKIKSFRFNSFYHDLLIKCGFGKIHLKN